MSESKFTPGPWEFDNISYIFKTPIGDGKMISEMRGWGWLQKKGELAGIEEQEANANLIAAAPDMYEAGKEMAEAVALLPCDDGRILGLLPILCRLRAALAKAEGKS